MVFNSCVFFSTVVARVLLLALCFVLKLAAFCPIVNNPVSPVFLRKKAP